MLTRPANDSMSIETDSSVRGHRSPHSEGQVSNQAEKFHFIEDDASEYADDEDWGIVSDDGTHVGSVADYRNGVLIVSGSEASSDGYPRQGHHNSPTDLSLPGTDSIPTDLDSLGIMSAARHVLFDAGSFNRGDDLSLDNVVDTNVLTREFWTKPKNLRLVAKGFAFLVAILLVWDRYSLQSSKSRLQEELRQLQQEQEEYRTENHTNHLMNKIPKVPPPTYHFDDLTWSIIDDENDENDENYASGGKWYDKEYTDFEEVMLADNCWVRAKASVSFGNCANDAKESFKDWSTKAYNSFEFFSHSVKDTFTTVKDQALDHNPFEGIPFQKAGISIETVSEATAVVAHAAVKASDAISKAVAVVDGSILQFLDVARDAIDEATASVRLDE